MVAGLLFASLYPSFFLLSRVLQQVLGHDPLAAGLLFLPVGVGVLIFAIAARKLMSVTGPRPLVLAGTGAATLGSAGLLFLDLDTPYAAVLLPCLVGLGAGVGVTFVATSALSMTAVPEADTGVASALLSTFQAVGGTVGVAVVASLAARGTEQELAAAGPPLTPDVLREALLAGSRRRLRAHHRPRGGGARRRSGHRTPPGWRCGMTRPPSRDRFYGYLGPAPECGQVLRARVVEVPTSVPAVRLAGRARLH